MLVRYCIVPVILCTIMVLVVMTSQFLTIISTSANKIALGSVQDSGVFPKRAKNPNFYFIPGPDVNHNVETVYPRQDIHTKAPLRIVIATTTKCPIFRQNDNGSVDPPLIG